MSSVKRRKVDEDVPSGLIKDKKKQKKAQTAKDVATDPTEALASSPKPAPAPTTKGAEETVAVGGDEAVAAAPKTFKDLVCFPLPFCTT